MIRWLFTLLVALPTLALAQSSTMVPGGSPVFGPNSGGGGNCGALAGDVTGTCNANLVSKVTAASSINKVAYADGFAGADMGAKINAAIASLPNGTYGVPSGVVDARGLTGVQTLSTAVNAQYVEIIFGQADITQSAIVTVGQTTAITCVPTGIGQGNNYGLTRFFQANSANLAEMFLVSGGQATMRDCVVDGNKSQNASGGPNIKITGSHYLIDNVTTQNSKSHGFSLISTGTSNQAGVGTFRGVTSVANTGDGLYCEQTADTTITGGSAFEQNAGTAGIEANNCPTMRLTDYDVGGNQIGFSAYGAAFNPGVSNGAQGQIIGHGQFGNQFKQDILIDGTNGGSYGNLISGASLIGSQNRTSNTYASVDLHDMANGGNVVGDLWIQSIAGHTNLYDVYIHGSEGADTISNVRGYGTIGTAVFNVAATTTLVAGCDTTAVTCTWSGPGLPAQTLYLATTTYTPSTNAKSVCVAVQGGGGGGGSGGAQVNLTAISGGAGGGAGGFAEGCFKTADISAPVTVTVGPGGAVATAPGGTTVAGTNGHVGTSSSFGSLLRGSAGGGGAGGQLAATSGGGGGGVGINSAGVTGYTIDGSSSTTSTGAVPGYICNIVSSGSTGGTGVQGAFGVLSGCGGGGSGGAATGAASNSSVAIHAATGGASGGGITSLAGANNGGNGATSPFNGKSSNGAPAGGTSGTPGGADGATPTFTYVPGGGAAGGYGNATGNGGAGGSGIQGGGGGGGGSVINGSTPGNGGKGGDGFVFVRESF